MAHGPAPSIIAASRIAGETLFIPATKTRKANGVHSHTLTMITAAIAVLTSDSHGRTESPRNETKYWMTPMFGSYMYDQISATTAGVSRTGMTSKTLRTPNPTRS